MDYLPPSLWRCAIGHLCPRCGGDKIFSSFMTVKSHCGRCGLLLADHDCGDGPASLAVFVFGFIAVPSALWIDDYYHWPWWGHALLWFPLLVLASMLCLPAVKSWLIFQQYHSHILFGQDNKPTIKQVGDDR